MAKIKTLETQNDIPVEAREAVVEILNRQLADTFDLFSQTKQAHWNVKGMDFIALHKLFDDLAGGLVEYADMIAERVTALGGVALGTARMAAAASTLPEFPGGPVEGHAAVVALVDRFAAYAASTRQAIDDTDDLGDMGTSDLFTEVVRGVDKALYFLEAHLQA